MFGSETLEVAIGIIFIYILISIMCTTIREGIEAWTKTRASYLERGIRMLLHDVERKGLAQDFYDHPLISSLYSGNYQDKISGSFISRLLKGTNLPAYIPAGNFSLALMDIMARGANFDSAGSGQDAPVVSLEALRTNIANISNPRVRRALLTAIDTAQGDLNKAKANIEAWYDSSMDRVSGWYKRTTHWILFVSGIIIAVGLNINTITIADYLYRNDAARAAIIARAETAATDPTYLNQNYDKVKQELDSMSLPIGWTAGWGAPRRGGEAGSQGVWNQVIAPILGWLMTAFAATLGAPFWFDLLNKMMVIRSTVKPHEKSPEESSEDRQPVKPASAAIDAGGGPITGGAAGVGVGIAPSPPPESIPAPMDMESDFDGCDVEVVDATPDEALPESKGGVA